MLHHTVLYYTVLFVQTKHNNTGCQIIHFPASSIYVYEQYFNSLYHVNNDEFNIQFASTIDIGDKNIYVVCLFLLILLQHPWAFYSYYILVYWYYIWGMHHHTICTYQNVFRHNRSSNDLCINCITVIKIAYRLNQTKLFNPPIFRIPIVLVQPWFVYLDSLTPNTISFPFSHYLCLTVWVLFMF